MQCLHVWHKRPKLAALTTIKKWPKVKVFCMQRFYVAWSNMCGVISRTSLWPGKCKVPQGNGKQGGLARRCRESVRMTLTHWTHWAEQSWPALLVFPVNHFNNWFWRLTHSLLFLLLLISFLSFQDNYNVLHIAAMYSREDVVKLLLTKRGVDPFSTGGVSMNHNPPGAITNI